MPELEFYHERKDKQPKGEVQLDKDEAREKAEDWEDIKNQRLYRDRKLPMWRRAASVYNVVQNATSDDQISNIIIGWTRMILDTGVAQISEGEPEFDFRPIGPTDSAKTILWRDMIKLLMARTNYRSQQNIFFIDWHVFGTACMEVYQELPHRTIRIPQLDGSYKEKIVRDFRRPRVGIRTLSPTRVTRNPTVSDPNEVPSCTKEEILTWNQFVQNYGRAKRMDGKPKYKHTDDLSTGSHVKLTHYWDEIRDVFRIYALPFGNDEDGKPVLDQDSTSDELGTPIFSKSLKIHEIRHKGKVLRSEGLNIQGKCPLIFATYNDAYDDDYQTHDVYGMGLPQHMEALDTLIQTFFNMNVDNWRMASTILLSYKGDGRNVPDFDSNQYYGGELFEGEVKAVPLGQTTTRDFEEIMNVINQFAIPMTGINFQQIIGDTSKTAFEFSQRIRANNRRAEQKLRVLEDGAFKRLGELLLSAGLSELTVEEMQDMTEEQVVSAKQNIKDRKETPEDFKNLTGKNPQRKVRELIPVEGLKESFTDGRSKTRKADPNASDNTLIIDKGGGINFIPAVKEYLYPAEYIERGTLPDVVVDSKRMLGDLKAQDTQTIQAVARIVMEMSQLDPQLAQNFNVPEFMRKIFEIAQLDYENLFGTDDNTEISGIMDQLKTAQESIKNPPDVQSPQAAVPQLDVGAIAPQQQNQTNTANPLQATATGTL